MTEVRVQAERSISAALQQHAASLGLLEWSGQVINVHGATAATSSWFSGVVFSTSKNSTSRASLSVQPQGPGIQNMLVLISSLQPSNHSVSHHVRALQATRQ